MCGAGLRSVDGLTESSEDVSLGIDQGLSLLFCDVGCQQFL